jgi:hypothetical protein
MEGRVLLDRVVRKVAGGGRWLVAGQLCTPPTGFLHPSLTQEALYRR